MIDPLYALPVAAEMVPFSSLAALNIWLSRHKADYPPRYRRLGHREIRLLSESEILRIRDSVVTNTSRRTKNGKRLGRPFGSKNGGTTRSRSRSNNTMSNAALAARAIFRVV
jgi:hypothetical protein